MACVICGGRSGSGSDGDGGGGAYLIKCIQIRSKIMCALRQSSFISAIVIALFFR